MIVAQSFLDAMFCFDQFFLHVRDCLDTVVLQLDIPALRAQSFHESGRPPI